MRYLANIIIILINIGDAFPNDCPMHEIQHEVLIFGGGVTGLTIGRQLFDNGITDIMILEARNDKVGGRIRSDSFAGVTIELGANWIQEVFEEDFLRDKHPIWKLAKDTPGCVNLQGHFTKTKEVWDEDQNREYAIVDDELVKQLQDEYYEAVKQITELSYRMQRNGEKDITIQKAFNIIGYTPTTALENVIEWFKFDFQYAVSPNETSLFASFPYEHPATLGDQDYFISDQRGFASFLDCITDAIESKIQLGAMVNNISWSSDCVCASVSINGSEDQTMCGKYGVVTFSIGVLQNWVKSDILKFNPPLNARKIQALLVHKMAYYLKIFLKFNSTFWNSNVDDILYTNSNRGYIPVMSPIGQLMPGYPGIVIVTVVDSEAHRLSFQDPEKTKEEIMVVLKKVYGNNIPNPTDILIPSWISDPLYNGMYTTPVFGFGVEDQMILKEPEGNLLLSGEGLSIEYMGYVHGGYCDGLSAANYILKKNNIFDNFSTLPVCP